MDFEDFPAAHSMDSGWFAIDESGALAHFDTGEAGAMPNDALFATGEAGGDDGAGELLWVQHVAPWIARNADSKQFPRLCDSYAVFDTAENALKAQASRADQANLVEGNPMMLQIAGAPDDDHWGIFSAFDGFVGFAPSLYDLWEDGVAELLPVNLYDHGDWDIPGHYERRAGGSESFKLDEDLQAELPRMSVLFSEATELNLADFYSNDECMSWSQGDLRTGEPIPSVPLSARDSWLGRLLRFFKG